jgi:hypothetical protein
MARYNWRKGDREPEANVALPDVLVYHIGCGCETCIAERPRIAETVEPITVKPYRERSRLGIDTRAIDAAQPTIATIPSIKRIG